MIFLLISRRRGIPDLMGAEAVHRVLSTSRGGTLVGVCLWSLF